MPWMAITKLTTAPWTKTMKMTKTTQTTIMMTEIYLFIYLFIFFLFCQIIPNSTTDWTKLTTETISVSALKRLSPSISWTLILGKGPKDQVLLSVCPGLSSWVKVAMIREGLFCVLDSHFGQMPQWSGIVPFVFWTLILGKCPNNQVLFPLCPGLSFLAKVLMSTLSPRLSFWAKAPVIRYWTLIMDKGRNDQERLPLCRGFHFGQCSVCDLDSHFGQRSQRSGPTDQVMLTLYS